MGHTVGHVIAAGGGEVGVHRIRSPGAQVARVLPFAAHAPGGIWKLLRRPDFADDDTIRTHQQERLAGLSEAEGRVDLAGRRLGTCAAGKDQQVAVGRDDTVAEHPFFQLVRII